MDIIKNKLKLQNNLEFLGNRLVKKNNYKNFFYKRNNFRLFKSDGKFNLHKSEYNILRYLKRLTSAKKKWKIFIYKKRYLLKKRYKKQFYRIKNHIQKNILNFSFEHDHRISTIFLNSYIQFNFNYKTKYNLNLFEILYLKIRLILSFFKNFYYLSK